MKCCEYFRHRLRAGTNLVAGAIFVILSAPGIGLAQDIPAPVTPTLDRMVGAMVVVLPEYEGSDEYYVTGAPLLMYKFAGDRYVQVIGNKAYLNVWNHPNWEAGLKGVYRFGRNGVDDGQVSQLETFDDMLELGPFIGYRQEIGGDFRHRYLVNIGLTHDVTGGHEGYAVELGAVYWRPVSKAVDLGFRLGLNYGSSQYMSSYFSVSASEAALTGLRQFDADAGFKDAKAGLMGVMHLSQNWHVGGGVFYGRLIGDAADSPIVDDIGSANQYFAGLSLLYSWRED